MSEPTSNKDKDNKDKDDDNMTPEERMAWLRERGVLVETPQERQQSQFQQAHQRADTHLQQQTVQFVKIPADASRDLEQWSFEPSLYNNNNNDPLSEHLQSQFSHGGENIDLELLRAQHTQTTTLTGSAMPPVSDAALRAVAQQPNVETFVLVHPGPSNAYTGAHLYLDEGGLYKRLPLNRRASLYAKTAGFDPPPVFYGDVFLARIQQQQQSGPDRQYRLSFVNVTVGRDTSFDAPWLASAVSDNLSHQLQRNTITGRHHDTQTSVNGSDGVPKQEDTYSWTQTEQELEVVLDPLPSTITAKQIQVVFRPQHLSIQVGELPSQTVDIGLFERIDMDGCTWTLERCDTNNKKLVVTMEKMEHAYWPRIRD